MGVIGCVRAGFEVVGFNVWLVAFPIALDLLLWLGPRLSISPLLEALMAFFRVQLASDPSLVSQVSQLGEFLDQVGQRFNLLSLLSSLPLLSVPSLLAGNAPEAVSPLGDVSVHLMTGLFPSIILGAGLLLVGLILGILFLNALAGRVAAMKPESEPRLTSVVEAQGEQQVGDPNHLLRLGRAFLFVAVGLAIAACVVPVWALVYGASAMVAPLLGIAVWAISVGLVGYACLHLLFVVHGVLLGGRKLIRAILESVVFIHAQLPAVAGLVLVIVVVYQGLGWVWSLPASGSWLTLVGIVGNACIATGLTAATFVFYEQRMPYALELVRQRRRANSA